MTEHLCPIWDEPLITPPRTVEGVYLDYSPRAGSVYGANGSVARGSRERPFYCSAPPRQTRTAPESELEPLDLPSELGIRGATVY